MRSRQCWFVVSAMAVVLLLPSRASADWVFTPYVGPAFAGRTGLVNSGSLFGSGQPVTFGGAVGLVGSGLGVEVDVGHIPRFFEGDSFLRYVVRSGVTTVMINGVAGIPSRGALRPIVRPYVSGGAGWLRAQVEDPFGIIAVRRTTPAFNVGGGAIGFLSDQVGIRGEVRYIRTFGGEESGFVDSLLRDMSFWRGTVGVAFRF